MVPQSPGAVDSMVAWATPMDESELLVVVVGTAGTSCNVSRNLLYRSSYLATTRNHDRGFSSVLPPSGSRVVAATMAHDQGVE